MERANLEGAFQLFSHPCSLAQRWPHDPMGPWADGFLDGMDGNPPWTLEGTENHGNPFFRRVSCGFY